MAPEAGVPLSNSINYPNDLIENAIKVVGEEDGIFNNDDYRFYFMAKELKTGIRKVAQI
jgi:hypothetical protein